MLQIKKFEKLKSDEILRNVKILKNLHTKAIIQKTSYKKLLIQKTLYKKHVVLKKIDVCFYFHIFNTFTIRKSKPNLIY